MIYGGDWKGAGILKWSERSDIFQAKKVLQFAPTTGNTMADPIQPMSGPLSSPMQEV